MKKISTLLAIVCAGCAPMPSTNIQNPVSFTQNGVRQELGYGINSQKEIRLKKSDLVIETRKISSDTAIQVCVTEDTQAVDKIKKSNGPFAGHCFTAGTGMAVEEQKVPEKGYPLFVTGAIGHNYYPQDRRVSKDGTTKIYINKIQYEDGVVEKSPTVILLIDSNKNSLMEDHELWSGKIVWE